MRGAVRIMKHMIVSTRRASSPIRNRNVMAQRVQRSYSVSDIELTEDQRQDLQQAFGMFKTSRKGKISARDLGPMLRCLGWNPSERDLEEARQELDVSASGRLTYADVEKYVSRHGGICHRTEEEEEDVLGAFKVLDKLGTGKIPVKDFRRYLTTMGDKMAPDEVEEIIRYAKKDSRGQIEYRDLIKDLHSSP
ncbi:Calmodulin [Mizuhopecten yessoensis]|uniref:Calmodulin n=2 Tax=Mizuhopecten yessoensis TaxID=6573 RepID=A0A210PUJ1_MIZYE|nr:Calmodulin [Mizuhopecten yessoensis]